MKEEEKIAELLSMNQAFKPLEPASNKFIILHLDFPLAGMPQGL
jgi:hypothetical protein